MNKILKFLRKIDKFLTIVEEARIKGMYFSGHGNV